jgi:hypothetical protein
MDLESSEALRGYSPRVCSIWQDHRYRSVWRDKKSTCIDHGESTESVLKVVLLELCDLCLIRVTGDVKNSTAFAAAKIATFEDH